MTTALIGIAALAFALGEIRLVFWFVLFAWSGLACAFTPVVLCSLFWRRTILQGAIAGMIAGFVTAVVWVVALKARTWGLYEVIPGFAAAFAVTIGVSLLTEPDPGVRRSTRRCGEAGITFLKFEDHAHHAGRWR